jgi:CHAT domain-containing protein
MSQEINEISKQFWNAVNDENNAEIVQNGKKFIQYIESNKFSTDTTIVEIYFFYSKASIQLKKYDDALLALTNISERIKLRWGDKNNYYTIVNGWISHIYEKKGDYQSQLVLELADLQILESTVGKYNSDYITQLNNLVLCYSNLGDLNNALDNALKLKSIDSLVNGITSIEYSSTLNTISSIYAKMGSYNKAIEFSMLSLKIKEKHLAANNQDIAFNLNNLGYIYFQMGNYDKSLDYHFKALKIRENCLGKNNELYAASLNNIALGYSYKGDFENSIKYQQESIQIKEKILGRNHPLYAVSLKNLAITYFKIGNLKKALTINKDVQKIEKRSIGIYHPSYATTLNNIGIIYYKMNKLSKALRIYKMAMEIRKSILGENHPHYRESLYNLMFLHVESKEYNKAFSIALTINDLACNYFKLNDFGLSTDDEILLKKELELNFNLISSIIYFKNKPADDIFNNWINLHGLVSTKLCAIEKQVNSSGDISFKTLINDYKIKKKQLLKYQELTITDKESLGLFQKQLEEEAISLERDISKMSQTFSEVNRTYSENDIKKKLADNEIYVDIVRMSYYSFFMNEWTDSIKYIIFFSKLKDSIVDHIFLNNGNELEKEHYFDYKLETSDNNNSTGLKNEVFYNSFWKPIADKIGDAETVYVSLGGVYNNINLNTLYNPETGKYLLEEKDIRVVNSARDFILSKEREKKRYTSTTSALYGFPDFNGNTSKSIDTTDYMAATRDLDQKWIDSLTRGGLKAYPLPATKVEVEQIARTFKTNGWNVTTNTGEAASETNIKQEVSPRVLHIATHGYFFEDIPMDKSSDRFLGMDRQHVVQDPMLRSGLLFTGANKTLKGESTNGENGLLSAAEASLLDLRETELVVLSACETGKGEIKNSEGVYGLRKAFADAGAQNIIMSLWKVDDKVTQEFMTRFYEIWLNDKVTIREAFTKTQLEIKAKYPQPYYWGAFILVGE